jgi:hypothetical protein
MLNLLEWLARGCALLAGVLLTTITLICCASIIGRNTTGWTLVGDFELVASTAGAAGEEIHDDVGALKLRQRQEERDRRAPAAVNAGLDRLGALLLALAVGLLAWRTVIGGLNAWKSGAGSMMLGFPEWIVYAFMLPPLVLTALIALVQAVRGFGAESVQ